MKSIRYLLFDFKQGILRNWPLLLSPVGIAAVTFFDFSAKAHRYLLDGRIENIVCYGDYWFYLYGGMHEYTPSPGNAFQFPIVWTLVFLVLPFILLNYPFKDMYGAGQQVLVRARKRTVWWLSKCCWNLFGTVFYHLIMQITGMMLFLVFQMDISNRIHMDFIDLVFRIGHQEVWQPSLISFRVLFLPVLVSAAINMLQMMISLFMKPMFSFVAVAVLLLTSAYLLSPFLIGNYAMAFRYDWMLKVGVSVSAGKWISTVILLIAVLIGLMRFRLYDILESN